MGSGEQSPAPVSAFRLPPEDHDPWLDLLPPDAESWPEGEEEPQLKAPAPPTRRPAPRQAAPADRRPGKLVRPYMVSGGRTSSSNTELEIEALVATTALGQARARRLSGERREIAALCLDVLSVAEVSAHLDVPLGVACVVVGDMAEEGLVQLHRPASPDARPDLALLERVLHGLRDL
jgi:Protein of unknown function (DUF742)